jgi:hypothetical protein
MAQEKMYCTRCGHVGKTERAMPGSILLEIVLWCCFFVPGLIYSLWRYSACHPVCAACKCGEVIPTDSPRALRELPPTTAPTATQQLPAWARRLAATLHARRAGKGLEAGMP